MLGRGLSSLGHDFSSVGRGLSSVGRGLSSIGRGLCPCDLYSISGETYFPTRIRRGKFLREQTASLSTLFRH